MLVALNSTNAGDVQFIQNFNCKNLKRWYHTNTVYGCERNYGMSWHNSVVDFVSKVMDIWVTLSMEFL